MEVRHVCVEARFGILVGEEADVGEFVAEDLTDGVCALAGQETKGYERDRKWQVRATYCRR